MRLLLLPLAAVLCLTAQESPAPPAKPATLPMKPERKLEFSTDEGTWLSVDVSKDGRTVLFDLLGDLYTVPLAGGQATRITSGLPFDSQPVYSPDSTKIAFVSDRNGNENLWIANADGSNPKQLSKEMNGDMLSPAWTHDGDFLLVAKSPQGLGAHELWMYNINGGAGLQVTKSAATPATPPAERLNFMGPIASPDNRFFYYSRRKRSFSYNAEMPLWQIVRRDRRTGEEDVITNLNGSAFRPVLSPDGKMLAYGTRFDTETGLRIRDLATGDDRWLKYPIQRDDQESRASRDVLPGYAFTPDGKEVVLCFDGKIQRVRVDNGAASPVPFTAQVALDLGPLLRFPAHVEEGPVKARLIQGAKQSPDGRKLAFSALTHVYVSEFPTGKPARITQSDTREFQPAWSPDGENLAWVTWSSTGGQVWKLRMTGRFQPQQLTTVSGFYRDPAWTPDGTRIVALRSSTQARMESDSGPPIGLDVVSIPRDGGEPTLIVPARGLGRPHFATEADRIYVYSPQGLVSFRFDGTDRRTHLKVVGKNLTGGPEPPPAQDVQMSPDGKMALALVTNQLYLITVPLAGGEAPVINVSAPSVPVKKLTELGADTFAWADGGKTITWSLGASYFRQALSTVSWEEPLKKSAETPETATAEAASTGAPTNAAPVPPDKKPHYEETSITVEVPRHLPKGSVLLRGAKIITMKGDEVIPDGDIYVVDNRISEVGKKLNVPKGTKVIELKGATIMPGIVDAHAHWTEVRRGILDMQNWAFLANLAYGVTTGRDPQTSTNDMFAYQDLVDTGEMLGPRAYSTGPGIFSNTDFQSLDEARNVVSRYQKYYRTNTVKSYVVGNRKQREWMVEACKENRMMPTTEGSLDLKLDLTHAIDGFSGNEHSLPIVPLYKDVVEVFAKSGIYYTPTLLVAYGGPWAENYFYETTEVHDDPKLRRFMPHALLDEKSQRRPWFRKEEHVFPKLAASAAKIVRAGGKVTIGGHGQIQGIQCHWEMWALQSGGLSNMEVLRAATLHGAENIGYAQDLGSIENGKLADLLVLNKDPLEDIHNTNTIRYVMKNGELFEGETLNQIWPQQKTLPDLWWWKDNPRGTVITTAVTPTASGSLGTVPATPATAVRVH